MVVERDEQNLITDFYCLDDNSVESAQTLFFDGIISTEIISLKLNCSSRDIAKLTDKYRYYDLSEQVFAFECNNNDKPLLLDFGTNSIAEINLKLTNLAQINSTVSLVDLIASCVYYPALVLGQEPDLKKGRCTGLLLWEKIDLINRCLTTDSRIRQL
jgi:hypothetical protein